MPKTKDEFKHVEPLEVFRKLESASLLRKDVCRMLEANSHYETNFRAKSLVDDIFNRMPVFTKNASARLVLYSFSERYTHLMMSIHKALTQD